MSTFTSSETGVPAGEVTLRPFAELHIERHPGRDPATVWLHHGVGSTRAWDTFLPAAAGGRRVIAYDRRGFGRSRHGRVFTPAMFEEDVDDLRRLLAAEAVTPVHLVGHSDGGTVALLLAARVPEAVASVAVIAAHVRGDPGTIGALRRMGHPSAWPAAMRRSLRRSHGDDWADVAGGWHQLWISAEWERWTIVEELAEIGCPVLTVHDRRDALSPPEHGETIAARVPSARSVWVESGGHDPHRSDPDAFVAALRGLWHDAEQRLTSERGH